MWSRMSVELGWKLTGKQVSSVLPLEMVFDNLNKISVLLIIILYEAIMKQNDTNLVLKIQHFWQCHRDQTERDLVLLRATPNGNYRYALSLIFLWHGTCSLPLPLSVKWPCLPQASLNPVYVAIPMLTQCLLEFHDLFSVRGLKLKQLEGQGRWMNVLMNKSEQGVEWSMELLF